jgi:hypothetical protein
VIAYQDLLGKTQAASFEDSLHTLIEHLETRQHQLTSALQETTTTLQVLKRLNGNNAGQPFDLSVLENVAHLEAVSLLQPQAAALTGNDEVADSTLNGTGAAEAGDTPQAKSRKKSSTAKGAGKTASKAEKETGEAQAYSGFHPRRSILKEFQGKILREALKMVLKRKQGQPVSIDEVMLALYGKNISEKNAEIARTVVIHELSKGKGDGHWTGVPQRKGYYWIQD